MANKTHWKNNLAYYLAYLLKVAARRMAAALATTGYRFTRAIRRPVTVMKGKEQQGMVNPALAPPPTPQTVRPLTQEQVEERARQMTWRLL